MSVKNPLAKYVAVALPVVGSYPGAEEISFPVSGQFGVADFAFCKQAKPGLTSRESILANMSQGVPRVRNAVKRCVDVSFIGPLPGHRFCSYEAHRGDADSFVTNRDRALGDGLLRFLERQRRVGQVVLQVSDLTVGGRDNLLLRRGLRKRRISLLLRLAGRTLSLTGLLLQLLNLAVAGLDLVLQLLNLLLLRTDRLLHLLQPAQNFCVGRAGRLFLCAFRGGPGCALRRWGCKRTGRER